MKEIKAGDIMPISGYLGYYVDKLQNIVKSLTGNDLKIEV